MLILGHARLHALILATFALIASSAAHSSHAQDGRPRLKHRDEEQTKPAEAQDAEKILSEEVRVPVFARDEFGHFDPTLVPDDVLIVEDGVPQEVKSVRRTPSSVLLLLDLRGADNPAMRASTTRLVAEAVVENLKDGDSIAVIGFGDKIERLQDWTTDKAEVAHTLNTKLISGKRARISGAIAQAPAFIKQRPIGNRHVVLITDGVEIVNSDENNFQPLTSKDLIAAQAVVHVISYTSFAREAAKKSGKSSAPAAPPGSVEASGIRTAGIDPTMPPTMNRGGATGPSAGAIITFDPAMRRRRKAYERALERSEKELVALAQETGGRASLPQSADEMIAHARLTAREIGSQYVVTYRPKRPLADAPAGERRRLLVAARRVGLTLRAPQSYSPDALKK